MRNTGAHQYTTAIAILEDISLGAKVVDLAGYTGPETLPPGVSSLRGYRGTWWMFRSDHRIEGAALWLRAYPDQVTTGTTPDQVYLDLWRADPGGWTSIASTGSPGHAYAETPVGWILLADCTYYVRIATVTPDVPVSPRLVGNGLSHLVDPLPPMTVDPTDPTGPPVGTGPAGLPLISSVSDAFDGADLDPGRWDTVNSWGALLDGQQLALTGTLATASSGYNIDSAFVRLAVADRAPGDECWASFLAQVAFGSPPTSWAVNIHVSDTISVITSSWVGDYGQAQDSVTSGYDPVAHAWLRLRSTFSQGDEGWLITMICEAGPAPGQWTQLMRSPPMYSELANTGFGVQFVNSAPVPVYLSDFNTVPTGVTLLYMQMPDGSYRKAGVAGQPLEFTLPDGSVREWPGSKYPLYQKQNDGSWMKVIG